MNYRILTTVILLASIWTISIYGFFTPGFDITLALMPRDTGQWWGVFTSVLVHQNLAHLITNTAPLILFLVLLQFKGDRTFFTALPLCLITGAVLLWCIGRTGAHIGASGLVFALFGFLIANAVFTRRSTDFLIALAVVAAYWGLLAGLLPGDPTVSWEGHVCGTAGGVCTSWLVSRVFSKRRRVAHLH